MHQKNNETETRKYEQKKKGRNGKQYRSVWKCICTSINFSGIHSSLRTWKDASETFKFQTAVKLMAWHARARKM